jgi:sugar lactone lactonase YvrE
MKQQILASLVAAAVLTVTLLTNSFARADDIYVSCYNSGNGTIYKYDSSGHRTIFASGLNCPWSLAADKSGNLYATNLDNQIYKYDSSGNRSTFASGVDCSALTFDNSGNLYASGNPGYDGIVLKFDSKGNRTTFVTGLGENVQGIAFDNSNNFYAATGGNGNGTIVKFDSNGNRLRTYSGPYAPRGLIFDSTSSSLYATGWEKIIKYDLNTNTTSTTSISGGWPWGIAFDSSRNLFVADSYKNMIYKFDPSGNRSTFASGVDTPYSIVVTPEPATLVLVGLGGLMLRAKNGKRKA